MIQANLLTNKRDELYFQYPKMSIPLHVQSIHYASGRSVDRAAIDRQVHARSTGPCVYDCVLG